MKNIFQQILHNVFKKQNALSYLNSFYLIAYLIYAIRTTKEKQKIMVEFSEIAALKFRGGGEGFKSIDKFRVLTSQIKHPCNIPG